MEESTQDPTTTIPPPTTLTESITETTSSAPAESENAFSWINSDNAMTLGFSILLVIGTIVWICIWCQERKHKESSKLDKRRNSKSRDKQISKSSTSSKQNERRDDLPGLPKTPSLASIQSTGSNYYDQLMGSGNIPKVKSISQYGALLAQQEPPPP